jgi:hypothetical protein
MGVRFVYNPGGANMASDIEAIIFDFGGVMVDFGQMDSLKE